jgi:hypothetical protein
VAVQPEPVRASGYEWVSSPFYLDLALRKPAVAEQ